MQPSRSFADSALGVTTTDTDSWGPEFPNRKRAEDFVSAPGAEATEYWEFERARL
jgi:hypothetical protein